MTDIASLVGDNLSIWTGAIERRSGAGRGGGKRVTLYGIERLRALILDLAVRGKLVPQDSEDEPAAVLLKNLTRQRARNQNARKAFENSSPPPFDVPPSWEWVQVSAIGHDWGSTEPREEFTYIDVGSIDQNKGVIDSPSILSADEAPSRARRIVNIGTVLYSTIRPYLLNIAIVDRVFEPSPIASTAFAVVHPYDGVVARYVYHYLRSPSFVAFVEGCQAGIAYPAINDRQFFSAWFPLPPLAEQQRIVAKVDELMALCDGLEEESAAALEAHQRLVECLLATLIDSRDATDLATNWSRLEAHFDTLFSTDESIKSLRQYVLNMAVRGKLVPQHVADGRAPVLDRAYVVEQSPPFDIPPNWTWARLGSLGKLKGGGTPSKARDDYWGGDIPWVSPKDMKADYISDAQLTITDAAVAGSAVNLIEVESVLFVVRGMILAHSFPVAISRSRLTINQDMKALVLKKPEMAEYLLRALKGLKPEMLARVQRSGHGTCRIEGKDYSEFLVPLPPIAEQRRIVAKVDDLMALCDQLEACLADAAVTQKHLADAIVEKGAA